MKNLIAVMATSAAALVAVPAASALTVSGDHKLTMPGDAQTAEVRKCRAASRKSLTIVAAFSPKSAALPRDQRSLPVMMARMNSNHKQLRLAGGKLWRTLPRPRRSSFTALAIDAQGGVIHVNSTSIRGSSYRLNLMRRMNPDGSVDREFGLRNGTASFKTKHDLHRESLKILRNGSIAVLTDFGTGSTLRLFSPLGDKYDTFGNGGTLSFSGKHIFGVESGDRRTLLVSMIPNSGSSQNPQSLIEKIDYSGAPVPSFGTSGRFAMPIVSSPTQTDQSRPLIGVAVLERSDGAILTSGSVQSGAWENDSTSEFAMIDPQAPSAPLWRSPVTAFFPDRGDSGFPDYADSQRLSADGDLVALELESTLSFDHPSRLHFAKVAPFEDSLTESGDWGHKTPNLAVESASWTRDGSAIELCAARLKRHLPTRLVVKRLVP